MAWFLDFVGGRWPGLTYLTKITLKVHLRKHQAPFQGDNTTHLEDEKVSRCTEVQMPCGEKASLMMSSLGGARLEDGKFFEHYTPEN